MLPHRDAAPIPRDEAVACRASDSFGPWLQASGGTIAITTYQAGKVVFLSWDGRQISVLMRHFDKPMGLAVDGGRMALACRNDVTLFANAPLLAPDYLENQRGVYDGLFLPRVSYWTGDLNVHDVAYANDGLWIVATRFCCLARLTEEFSFRPVWRPPFLSDTVPEDRCHLNGLAVVDGRPKYVTVLGETDDVGAWRKGKATGGAVLDVDTGQVLCRGLAMPHSPRWHDNSLWVLNSGAGEFWKLDPNTGRHDIVCTMPGYLRGLCFVGPFALVGLCQIRERHIFGGLPVQQRFESLLCALAVVDWRSGKLIAQFEFTAGCQELFDVKFLPGLRRPMLLNQEKEAVRQAFTAPDFSYWLRPSNVVFDATHEPQ